MLRNIGSNWAVTLVSSAATYILTPFIIHTLGREGYGTWTLITAMTGYMTLLALGVPMACVRYLAEHVAAHDTRAINRAIGSCIGLYLAIGIVSIVIGIALIPALTTIYDIPVELQWEARFACAVMVLQVSAGFVGLLPEGILFAHHDFVTRNIVRIGAVILRLGLTVGLLTIHSSLVLLAAVQLACLVFDFGASLVHAEPFPEWTPQLRAEITSQWQARVAEAGVEALLQERDAVAIEFARRRATTDSEN